MKRQTLKEAFKDEGVRALLLLLVLMVVLWWIRYK